MTSYDLASTIHRSLSYGLPADAADLAPVWIPDFLIDAIDPLTVASAEQTLQAIFLFEFFLRAWSERFSVKYLSSPVRPCVNPVLNELFGVSVVLSDTVFGGR